MLPASPAGRAPQTGPFGDLTWADARRLWVPGPTVGA
ncbi:hypothetical protein Celf_0081 [Cellulomonas fimi ATCC 484]|uniref:Uncharacterized protein n=1 Tax=Cellulomonas fimi (strain ATCC 484 / DSM 20113 / JCM 1341 / CCUG 24087 / LMG 16345 / NBRC 15513 / NCIMB 8980 / NCTC 7547 / NRS-133) TaxID=590998 RepID=F4H4N0_CELFA|nr:hypothetical protein Celf_0081 [Cellulomonas fimi ATCC 484]VEH25932.1 Uncharacterised protein [Cellulomonas fimi]